MAEDGGTIVLDRSALEERTFGDRDLAADVLGLFEAQCRRLLPAVSGQDRGAAREAAHALRGSALGIGAGRVAALCGTIEDALVGRAGDERPLLRDLGQAVDATLAEIARWRSTQA